MDMNTTYRPTSTDIDSIVGNAEAQAALAARIDGTDHFVRYIGFSKKCTVCGGDTFAITLRDQYRNVRVHATAQALYGSRES